METTPDVISPLFVLIFLCCAYSLDLRLSLWIAIGILAYFNLSIAMCMIVFFLYEKFKNKN